MKLKQKINEDRVNKIKSNYLFFLRGNFTATLRIARLTLQTRELWLVGVATDRDARHACLRFFSFYYVFLFFFLASKKSTRKRKRGASKVFFLPRRLKKCFSLEINLQHLMRPKKWKKKNKLNPGPVRSHSALQANFDLFLIFNYMTFFIFEVFTHLCHYLTLRPATDPRDCARPEL